VLKCQKKGNARLWDGVGQNKMTGWCRPAKRNGRGFGVSARAGIPVKLGGINEMKNDS